MTKGCTGNEDTVDPMPAQHVFYTAEEIFEKSSSQGKNDLQDQKDQRTEACHLSRPEHYLVKAGHVPESLGLIIKRYCQSPTQENPKTADQQNPVNM
jgi:hypothetical protein